MPLVHVNGISTAGKSSVALELVNRGYTAYDLEHNGISAWYNKSTCERVAEFDKMPERTKTWMLQHEWRISEQLVNDIALDAKDKTVFLCGGGANEDHISSLCDIVIWLKTDENNIRRRVVLPRDHAYGTRPHELEQILASNKTKETAHQNSGFHIVDATRSLDKVVNEILTIAHAA